MALSLVTAPQHEVKLSASVKRKLLLRLKTITEIKQQMAELDALYTAEKDEIEKLREESGEKSLEIDGHKITLVEPVRKSFDKKKFCALGGDLAIYEQAMVSRAGKAYTKVTLPGDKEREDGE